MHNSEILLSLCTCVPMFFFILLLDWCRFTATSLLVNPSLGAEGRFAARGTPVMPTPSVEFLTADLCRALFAIAGGRGEAAVNFTCGYTMTEMTLSLTKTRPFQLNILTRRIYMSCVL